MRISASFAVIHDSAVAVNNPYKPPSTESELSKEFEAITESEYRFKLWHLFSALAITAFVFALAMTGNAAVFFLSFALSIAALISFRLSIEAS